MGRGSSRHNGDIYKCFACNCNTCRLYWVKYCSIGFSHREIKNRLESKGRTSSLFLVLYLALPNVYYIDMSHSGSYYSNMCRYTRIRVVRHLHMHVPIRVHSVESVKSIHTQVIHRPILYIQFYIHFGLRPIQLGGKVYATLWWSLCRTASHHSVQKRVCIIGRW